MNALNDVSKLHGENSVAAARSGCETRRRQKADQILRVAIESAQTSLDRASFKEAGQTLRKADSAAAFAGHVQQSEFQRMIRASGTGAKRNNTAISPNRGIRYVVASIVLIVAIAAIGLFRFRHTNVFTRNRTVVPASPAPIQTDLEINSSPWATIRQVQDGKGKGVALPGIDHTTPLRLDGLTPGDYKVTLADPEGKQRTVTCRVSSLDHLCSSDLGAPDLQQLLSGGQ
jgi:serine/threonine-protein kinase